jgi:hypothetical protein
MGIYDFYRRPLPAADSIALNEKEFNDSEQAFEPGEEMSPRKAAAVAMPVVEENVFEVIAGALGAEARAECERSGEGAEDHPRRFGRLYALSAP